MNKNRIRITPDNAAKLLSENRIIANQYIKNGFLTKDKIKEIQISLEKSFANIYIDDKIKKIDLSDDILLSYYKEHKNDFFVGEQIEFVYVKFDSFDSAYKFYILHKDDVQKINFKNLSKKENAIEEVIEKKMPLKKLASYIRFLVDKNKTAPYITTPQKDISGYFVIQVDSIIKNEKYLSYQNSKNKIKYLLTKKNRNRIKSEILNDIKKN